MDYGKPFLTILDGFLIQSSNVSVAYAVLALATCTFFGACKAATEAFTILTDATVVFAGTSISWLPNTNLESVWAFLEA
jgi:hypothetical protein